MISIVHMCGHYFKNVADQYISESVHKVFERKMGAINWLNYDIRKLCSELDIRGFNDYDAIVIGGGGFILPSSFLSKPETGWVIGIPLDLIKQIEVPIIGFSVGCNLFRGEALDSPIFVENFNALLERSPFFSLRHNGDIAKMKAYVGTDYDIKLNFCSSLFGREYKEITGNTIAFQLAWDRIENRFGSVENASVFVEHIEWLISYFAKEGCNVAIVSHTNSDVDANLAIWEKLRQKRVCCEFVDLTGEDPDVLVNFYYGVKTIFTMRGHGQMIPMGLGSNVVSLISHDKMQYLLEDLGITRTGVEVNDENFIGKCLDAYAESSNTDFGSKLKIAKQNIDNNMEAINEIICK